MPKQPVALIILDGFAFRDEQFGNAVAQAKNLTLIDIGRVTHIQH